MRTLLTLAAASLVVAAPLHASAQGNYFHCEYTVKPAPKSTSKVHILSGIFVAGQPDKSTSIANEWKAYVTASYSMTDAQRRSALSSCLALSQDESGRTKYVDDETAQFKAQHDVVATIEWHPGKQAPAAPAPLPIGGSF
jgi:hypothetical protein